MRTDRVLRVFAGLFVLAMGLYLVGPFVWPGIVRERPFAGNSVVKVTLLGLCCLHASGWPGRHRPLVLVALLAHVVSVVVMGIYLARLDTSRLLGDGPLTLRGALVGAMALDGVILALLGWVLAVTRAEAVPVEAPFGPEEGSKPLGRAGRRLRALLLVLGVVYAIGAVTYAALPFATRLVAAPRELPFVSNSAVMSATFSMLCFFAAKDARRRVAATDTLFVGLVVFCLTSLVLAIGAEATDAVGTGVGLPARTLLLAGAGASALVATALLLAVLAAWREHHGLAFLRPLEFRVLSSLAEILVEAGPSAPMSPDDVAMNADRHFAQIRAHRVGFFRIALFATGLLPLLRLRPPSPEMAPALRKRWLTKSFGYAPFHELPSGAMRRGLVSLVRTVNQLVYVGWYGDPRTHASIGYLPFSKRPARPFESPPGRTKSTTTLPVVPVAEIPDSIDVDYCVIGSGAAGSTIACELSQRSPAPTVLLVERGKYVAPKDFTEDELEMVGRLYADGVMQQTRDFELTVLQGSCVGGGTTVNNGVVFDPPADVIERWNREFDAGIDAAEFDASVQIMRRAIGVRRQHPTNEPAGTDPDDAAFLNPSSFPFIEALRKHQGDRYEDAQVVEANIEDCLGHGYENIGDAYGRKRGALETLLPRAVATGHVTIWAEAEVDLIHTAGGRRTHVESVEAALSDGRRVRIRAKTFVVSAGPVASSWLLLRNGIRCGGLVGTRFSANLGTYLTCVLDHDVHAERGLQISHYAIPVRDETGRRPYVLETWFNPPAIQSANMPGWFDDHRKNMLAYGRMMAVGVLVPTEATGTITPAWTGGPEVDLKPSSVDLARLVKGLRSVGEIALGAGAVRVMANTWKYREFTKVADLSELEDLVVDSHNIALGTGHPQGGNPMSRDPKRGVVDASFRVHGFDNLHVCDASVFPTALGVNPQMTVFALAHYASKRI